MTSILRAIAVLGVALFAGAALAVEAPQRAVGDPHRHQPAGREEARNDSTMQAICREVLVETDEGYGVTNHESRVICDQTR
jgi:hypothetical protein